MSYSFYVCTKYTEFVKGILKDFRKYRKEDANMSRRLVRRHRLFINHRRENQTSLRAYNCLILLKVVLKYVVDINGVYICLLEGF